MKTKPKKDWKEEFSLLSADVRLFVRELKEERRDAKIDGSAAVKRRDFEDAIRNDQVEHTLRYVIDRLNCVLNMHR